MHGLVGVLGYLAVGGDGEGLVHDAANVDKREVHYSQTPERGLWSLLSWLPTPGLARASTIVTPGIKQLK